MRFEIKKVMNVNSNHSDSTEIKRRMKNLLSFESKKEKEEFDELTFHFKVMNEIKEILIKDAGTKIIGRRIKYFTKFHLSAVQWK